ncbi:MAG: HIT family protein [bacterium]
MDCIFCKIAKGEIESAKVFENDNVFVFLDIAPASKGHCLVIPKQHYENIFDIDESALIETVKMTKEISDKIRKNLKAIGVNIIINNGKEAGQSALHFHIHIVPRYENDGLTGADLFAESAEKTDKEKLKKTAEKIKA